MVVLPLLGTRIHFGRLRILLRYSHGTDAYLCALCHHDVVRLWREIAHHHYQQNPYAARMQAMFIFALFPLLALFAQPLGNKEVFGEQAYWFPIIIIGIAGAAHQSWSANIYSVVGDMFPKSTIATIVGIGGMAGGISSFLINMSSGLLFDYADKTQMVFLGFQGKPAGYFIIFCVCAVSYLIGWCIMKALVPKYKPIIVD